MRRAGNTNMHPQSTPAGGMRARRLTLRSFLQFSMPVSVLFYCAAFQYSYVNWISPVWGYGGLTYRSPNPALLAIGYTLAAAMCVDSPRKQIGRAHV